MKAIKIYDDVASMGDYKLLETNAKPHVYATKDGGVYISDYKYMVKYSDGTKNYSYSAACNSSGCYSIQPTDLENPSDIVTLFVNCDLGNNSIKIGDDSSVKKVDFTNIENVLIGNKCEYIGGLEFSGCTKLRILNSQINKDDICEIDNGAFNDCKNLFGVVIAYACEEKRGANSFKLASNSFKGCENIQEVICSNILEQIGSGAFSLCINLKQVTLNGKVNNIHSNAFDTCSGLTKVIFLRETEKATNVTLTDSAFNNTPIKTKNIGIEFTNKTVSYDNLSNYITIKS